MTYKNYSSKGPEIRLRFETSEGIVAGKTEIRCRSVTIGKVTKVELAEDLNSVFLYCTLDSGQETLLRKGTRFWVVRPRVSGADISGLGTFLTGVYIELEPGTGELGPRKWKGRETPPPTSRSVPGLRISLMTQDAGTLTIGSPVQYRGLDVGRVESRKLSEDGQNIRFEIFIRDEFKALVRTNTKFWNTGGVDVSAGVDGFKFKTPSLQVLVSGGISFGVLDGATPAEQATDGISFRLHSDENAAEASTFDPTLQLLLLFDQSVRGLKKLAPVEYRGIEIGRVINISFDLLSDPNNRQVPVLLEIDPQLIRSMIPEKSKEKGIMILEDAVKNGLRATLKTGSLLTGAMYVDFDYYLDEKPKQLTEIEGKHLMPTRPSGFAQLEEKLTSILNKIDALPVEETLQEIKQATTTARKTLENEDFKQLPTDLRKTLAELDKTISSAGPDGNLQGDLLRTLDELRGAIRSMEAMTDTIKERPNSIFFGNDESKNPQPKSFLDR
jgi:paraquat-inducible protein B